MTLEKVQGIISEQVNVPADEIKADSSIEQLKIDSLDMVEIIMRIEEEFDITVDENIKVQTVSDLISYIDGAKK